MTNTATLDTQGIKIVRSTSTFDCGGRCPIKLHVKDGEIIRIEGDDADEPDQLRTCLRCRAIRKYVHHPERLKYPLKRVGPKGEGKFERISWDEAYETIAEKLIHAKETYGNSSIFLANCGGYLGALHNGTLAMMRLFNQFGGYSSHYGNVSSEGAVWACLTHYGSVMVGHSREDLMNSKLIIMWGWDPARMISGTNTMYHLIRAKENGARMICIDPRFHDSAAVLADQWIPIIPGTDTALMASIAYVMIKENLHDKVFLDTYTLGFDKYCDYVMGEEDGIEKTPAWAEAITGVPADTIEALAKEYATTKPAALMDCQGPARSAAGEQYNRGAMTLCAMTGNVGRAGGSAGGGLMGIPIGHMFFGPGIPPGKNPAETGGPSIRGTLDLNLRLVKRVHTNKLFDAIDKGRKGGYPFDVKFAWFVNNNFLNQLGNTNKSARILKELNFMVVSELFLTPTARYADIVLPVTSSAEKNDLTRPWPSGPYFTYVNKAIDPIGECKSDLTIATELSEKLGIDDFASYDEDEILKMFVDNTKDMKNEIKDYDTFKKKGIHRIRLDEPIIAFKKEIEDPENNPFSTPSGKIEIFSQRVADMNNPLCPPVPKYVGTWEDRNDPLAQKYPLQLLSPHPKNRVHSEMFKVDWLREVESHRAWINPVDAEQRGIKDGDDILVFNDRGTLSIPAWLTERIMPGVISIFEGAWYAPDKNGIDQGGCANVLTKDAYSEGGASALKTCLVQIKKA
ncbi:MAG: molybdopterin-dependent oxidoreductase [Desulfobacterales bacterium]|nr:molybdopterin-dependent oxidoreductase [Desulfobacterales bacterium]